MCLTTFPFKVVTTGITFWLYSLCTFQIYPASLTVFNIHTPVTSFTPSIWRLDANHTACLQQNDKVLNPIGIECLLIRTFFSCSESTSSQGHLPHPWTLAVKIRGLPTGGNRSRQRGWARGKSLGYGWGLERMLKRGGGVTGVWENAESKGRKYHISDSVRF